MRLPVYMDSHATTPLDPQVLNAMMPYMTQVFGNPSSLDHSYGYEASVAVENARNMVADMIGSRHDEIVFTSGATESDSMAIRGVVERYAKQGNHIITCATEHEAVLDTARYMESIGKRVTYLPVDPAGAIDMGDLEEAITPDTVLVSVMAANNETGTMQDIRRIGEIARRHGIIFHTDAAQAAGHIPVDVDGMNIDLLSMSAHKMCGPKGTGALYIRGMRPVVRLAPLVRGGGQERSLRSGTLNVPGIVGFGEACRLARKGMDSENAANHNHTKYMMYKLAQAGAVQNGESRHRLAHNLNVRFPGIEGKAIINTISQKVAISAGSACTTQSVKPSHVLLAMGLTEAEAHQSVRFGLNRFTTREEVEFAVETVLEAVDAIRASTA